PAPSRPPSSRAIAAGVSSSAPRSPTSPTGTRTRPSATTRASSPPSAPAASPPRQGFDATADGTEGFAAMFMMPFDMRAPATGAPAADLYTAALDMAGWTESRGCVAATICEHHTSSDGYLPSPLVLASAMAARTTSLPIVIAVVLLPLY